MNNELLKAGIRWNACFLFNNPEAEVIKAEILPGRGKEYGSKKTGKAKEKRDGTIGLMGGFARPKARMISGFSLKTSAIYDRIYLGFLCDGAFE